LFVPLAVIVIASRVRGLGEQQCVDGLPSWPPLAAQPPRRLHPVEHLLNAALAGIHRGGQLASRCGRFAAAVVEPKSMSSPIGGGHLQP
jgi:hypothetical protein